jgi:hypothetical protein
MTPRPGFLALSVAVLLASGTVVRAQNAAPPVKAVVELFTSQGCSSCPPADAFFAELSKDPSVIALTLPVTYWDYLGWKDTLGQEVFTKRQKFYAKARGDGQVYTPQAVINGAGHLVGSDKVDIERGLRQPGRGFATRVALREQGDTLRISLSAAEQPGSAGVWVVPTSRLVSVPIGRGENQGKTIAYANVVRGMIRVSDWDGKETVLTTPLATTRAAEADSYVVLVQAEQPGKYGMMPGAVLGAARGR